jgi:hypothetical protein
MNLFSQGIDPELDFFNINEIIAIYEESTHMAVPPRHPYAGNLVYTAFSGSHQDAINKGLSRMRQGREYWEVPYLPIDPLDVGRSYDPIIRINSQSGKGGIAFILEQNFGYQLPKTVQQAFSAIVTRVSDQRQAELTPDDLHELFLSTYVNRRQPLDLIRYREEMLDEQTVQMNADILVNGQTVTITGSGNGLLEAFSKALQAHLQSSSKSRITMNTLWNAAPNPRLSLMSSFRTVAIKHISGRHFQQCQRSSLRAIISAINQIPESANNAGADYSPSAERRLPAIKRIWATILRIRQPAGATAYRAPNGAGFCPATGQRNVRCWWLNRPEPLSATAVCLISAPMRDTGPAPKTVSMSGLIISITKSAGNSWKHYLKRQPQPVCKKLSRP